MKHYYELVDHSRGKRIFVSPEYNTILLYWKDCQLKHRDKVFAIYEIDGDVKRRIK